jgi:hypothetical protein
MNWFVRGVSYDADNKGILFNVTLSFIYQEGNMTVLDYDIVSYNQRDGSTSHVEHTLNDVLTNFITTGIENGTKWFSQLPFLTTVQWPYIVTQWNAAKSYLTGQYDVNDITVSSCSMKVTYSNGTTVNEDLDTYQFRIVGSGLLSFEWHYLKKYGILYHYSWMNETRWGNFDMKWLQMRIVLPNNTNTEPTDNGTFDPKIILGVVVGVCIVCVAALLYRHRRKKGRQRRLIDETVKLARGV